MDSQGNGPATAKCLKGPARVAGGIRCKEDVEACAGDGFCQEDSADQLWFGVEAAMHAAERTVRRLMLAMLVFLVVLTLAAGCCSRLHQGMHTDCSRAPRLDIDGLPGHADLTVIHYIKDLRLPTTETDAQQQQPLRSDSGTLGEREQARLEAFRVAYTSALADLLEESGLPDEYRERAESEAAMQEEAASGLGYDLEWDLESSPTVIPDDKTLSQGRSWREDGDWALRGAIPAGQKREGEFSDDLHLLRWESDREKALQELMADDLLDLALYSYDVDDEYLEYLQSDTADDDGPAELPQGAMGPIHGVVTSVTANASEPKHIPLYGDNEGDEVEEEVGGGEEDPFERPYYFEPLYTPLYDFNAFYDHP